MSARNALRLFLVVLAGTLALPLVVSVLALRGPAFGARAADGAPAVVATVAVGSDPWGVAVNPDANRIYVANGNDDTVSVIEDIVPPTPVPPTPTRTPTPGRPPGVGGTVKLPPISDIEALLQAQSSWRAKDFVVIGAAAGFVLLLTAGAWVVKRRGDGW